MNPKDERELEALVGQELRQLPDLLAPGSLVHRVMLAVHQREALPWYRRSWPAWPAALQVVSILLMAVFAGGLMALTIYPSWVPGLETAGGLMGDWLQTAAYWLAQGFALIKACFITSKALGREILVFALILAVLGYLATVGILTFCYRVVARRI
jgi:hypothetical protein